MNEEDDSLYSKIDQGIDNCRLMISFLSTKYVFSPSCQREITLANRLEKPTITILLDSNLKHGQDEKIERILNESKSLELKDHPIKGWSDDKIKELADMIKLQLC